MDKTPFKMTSSLSCSTSLQIPIRFLTEDGYGQFNVVGDAGMASVFIRKSFASVTFYSIETSRVASDKPKHALCK